MRAAGQHSRFPRENEFEKGEESIASSGFQSEGPPSTISNGDICQALNRVLDSPEFSSVVQLRAFLNYIIAKTVENRGDEIKGYTIAVEALGRDSSFNPVTDPIVRVEAARLRRRLGKYYSGTGKNDPILIEIPKGSYAPEFMLRQQFDDMAADISPKELNPGHTPVQAAETTASADASAASHDLEKDQEERFRASLAEEVSDPAPSEPAMPIRETFPDRNLTDLTVARRVIPIKIWLPLAALALIFSFLSGYLIGAFP